MQSSNLLNSMSWGNSRFIPPCVKTYTVEQRVYLDINPVDYFLNFRACSMDVFRKELNRLIGSNLDRISFNHFIKNRNNQLYTHEMEIFRSALNIQLAPNCYISDKYIHLLSNNIPTLKVKASSDYPYFLL